MAMPWSRAKKIAAEYRDGTRDVKQLTALFDACFRIQREASEAAGRHIPLVVENVKGAQKWVGRARGHFGSFYLWGDLPALMPMVVKRHTKTSGLVQKRDRHSHTRHMTNQSEHDHIKNSGGSWFNIGSPGQKETNRTPVHEGVKNGKDWFGPGADCSLQRRASSGSKARKAASAMIAKIPFILSQHIARAWKPMELLSHD